MPSTRRPPSSASRAPSAKCCSPLAYHSTYSHVSMWGQQRNEGDEAAETVREGEMPLKIYLPTHPEARLIPPSGSS